MRLTEWDPRPTVCAFVTLLSIGTAGCAGYAINPGRTMTIQEMPPVDTPIRRFTTKGDTTVETRTDVRLPEDGGSSVVIRATRVSLCSSTENTVVHRAVTTERSGNNNKQLVAGWIFGTAGAATLGTGLALGLGTDQGFGEKTPATYLTVFGGIFAAQLPFAIADSIAVADSTSRAELTLKSPSRI